MSNQPREVLIEIVARYGDPLLDSPARVDGLLKDYCGEFRPEISVLVGCLRAGAIVELRRQNGPLVKLACTRLALELGQQLAVSRDLAMWAVESWAVALGLLDPHAPDIAVGSPATVANPSQQIPAGERPPPQFLAQEFESRWAVPDWSAPAGEIVVQPEPGALRDAVRDAIDNKKLLLMPGVYKDSIVVKRDLQIWAAGGPGEVILESPASSIVLESGCLLVAGITLRGVAAKDKKALASIDVKSGRLVMEDCNLTSDFSVIMEVKGPQSEVVLRRCDFHDGKAGGITFLNGALGYLETCNFFQNKLSHVVIGKGCAPTLTSCRISNALMAGIYVNEGGGGLIENCDIWANAVAGVQARRGGNPHVRHSRISKNGRYGLLLAEEAVGLFEDCEIFENAGTGVTARQNSRPRFSRCRIFDNRGPGTEIIEQAEGEFLECEIFDNGGSVSAVTEAQA